MDPIMSSKKPTRAALYARVSTDEQKHDLQLDALRQAGVQQGWLVTEYVDKGSGSGAKLPERDRMMKDARGGKIDVVAVWRFDRFARSVKDLVEALDTFRVIEVQFVSLQDGADTTTPGGELLFHIMAGISQFEKRLIRERVMAGLAAAKKRGKVLGRPKVAVDVQRALRLHNEGKSWRRVARALSIDKTTLRRAMKTIEGETA